LQQKGNEYDLLKQRPHFGQALTGVTPSQGVGQRGLLCFYIRFAEWKLPLILDVRTVPILTFLIWPGNLITVESQKGLHSRGIVRVGTLLAACNINTMKKRAALGFMIHVSPSVIWRITQPPNFRSPICLLVISEAKSVL